MVTAVRAVFVAGQAGPGGQSGWGRPGPNINGAHRGAVRLGPNRAVSVAGAAGSEHRWRSPWRGAAGSEHRWRPVHVVDDRQLIARQGPGATMIGMATKQRRADLGADRARRIVAELAAEIRRARFDRGLSQRDLGRAVGLSPSAISRLERGPVPDMSVRQSARLLAAVGLELSARAYPTGQPVRDRAHRALPERLRGRLNPSLTWRVEVPLDIPGDPRGWDAMVDGRGWSVGVEAETHVSDCQALIRGSA